MIYWTVDIATVLWKPNEFGFLDDTERRVIYRWWQYSLMCRLVYRSITIFQTLKIYWQIIYSIDWMVKCNTWSQRCSLGRWESSKYFHVLSGWIAYVKMFPSVIRLMWENCCALIIWVKIQVYTKYKYWSQWWLDVSHQCVWCVMKERGRSITVKFLMVHYSTRRYRRKKMAHTPSVRCMTVATETRPSSVMSGSIPTTSVILSPQRWLKDPCCASSFTQGSIYVIVSEWVSKS